MPRIAGVDLPRNKSIEIALTYIFGIGRKLSKDILNATGINPTTKSRDLSEKEITALRKEIEGKYKVEAELKREIHANINRLIEIGSYRGMRHKQGLPVRGQRTHTNARTRKGPRKPVGIKKKKKMR